MIKDVFENFIARDYSPMGVKNFLGYIEPGAMAARRERGDHFMLVARRGASIRGVVEVRNCNHLCLLFVHAADHRRGIARLLLDAALHRCAADAHSHGVMTVNSSPYAVYIYKKLGFVEKGPSSERDGIIYVPMVLYLSEP